MGRDENSDEFMQKVALAIEEMFPENARGIDRSKQESVIRAMYERKAAIPLFKGDDNIVWGPGEEDQFDELSKTVSTCDVIFEYGGERQPMEVIEHVLHHVSMVGLHYTFYSDWGVNRISNQYTQMVSAIDNN